MDEFEQEVKSIFLEEAVQIISDLEQGLLNLEGAAEQKGTLDEIFRLAHNLKGSSKAVGFDTLGGYVHEFESTLLNVFKLQRASGERVQDAISFFLGALDTISKMVERLRADLSAQIDISEALTALGSFNERWKVPQPADHIAQSLETSNTADTKDEKQEESNALSFLDLPENAVPSADAFDDEDDDGNIAESSPTQILEVLDAGMESSPNAMPSATSDQDFLAPNQEAKDIPIENSGTETNPASLLVKKKEHQTTAELAVTLRQARPVEKNGEGPGRESQGGSGIKKSGSDESIRVSLERLENLIDYVGEIVILHTVLEDQIERGDFSGIKKMLSQLGKVTKDVQDLSMGLRMIPLKNSFQKMQRIVRDTGRALGKDVQLEMEGEETELDKTVLDALNDPLTHLVRNAVDHGIEAPDVRMERGKPQRGLVRLRAFHRSGKMVIELIDDGGGINIDKIHAKAYEKGILKPGIRLPDAEAQNLIFHPGFSTKDVVSEVSGRGVGMDVVRTNIEALQGEVQVESDFGKGSCFRIVLPLTLAIIDGMIVRSGAERFVVPLSHVYESVHPRKEDIVINSGIGELLILRHENIPLYRLRQLLGQPWQEESESATAIVIRTQSKVIAVMVDDIIGQHQVVIKKLGKELGAISGYLGSAILGDGRPSLILELPELVDKFGSRGLPSLAKGKLGSIVV